ncbi:MAG: hypothetical protein GF320_03000, partial [Armatimonadia bacterium]|nr:hypothetical protein [Armatimonadia bacterium]
MKLAHWLIGLVLSTALIWTTSLRYTDGVEVLERDDALGRYMNAPGIHRERAEGWADTHFGAHGIPGVPDIAAIDRPKVIFWGDSFVEGLGVADEAKMPAALTELVAQGGSPSVFAFGIGRAGWDVADYYFLIPEGEDLSPPVAAHIIVLGTMQDVYPVELRADQDVGATFALDPAPILRELSARPNMAGDPSGPALLELGWKPPGLEARETARATRTEFLLQIYLGAKEDEWGDLRFQPGPVPDRRKKEPVLEPTGELLRAWDFLLPALAARTRVPLYFVYLPDAPALADGSVRMVGTEDAVA